MHECTKPASKGSTANLCCKPKFGSLLTSFAGTLMNLAIRGIEATSVQALRHFWSVTSIPAFVPCLLRTDLMTTKKSDLYSSPWASCDEWRGGVTDIDGEPAGVEQQRKKTPSLKQAMMQKLLTGKTRLV
jgi:hypothetical protein